MVDRRGFIKLLGAAPVLASPLGVKALLREVSRLPACGSSGLQRGRHWGTHGYGERIVVICLSPIPTG
uniref:Twin-arginine translocation signal domain-containing protein n=1 Tax=Desulfacinum infernum TaxID=35837 RepID=A0A832EJF2_9BACT